jgi:hypothetical protein
MKKISKKQNKKLAIHKINNSRELELAHKRLWGWFAKYIRLRDLELIDTGTVAIIQGECISCGKVWRPNFFSDKSIMDGKNWVAGHYWKSDRYASVRYDERNVNLQCQHPCNEELSGNESNYAIGLKLKIGEDGFEDLDIERNKIKHWDVIELDQLTEIYKAKVKERAKELGVKY